MQNGDRGAVQNGIAEGSGRVLLVGAEVPAERVGEVVALLEVGGFRDGVMVLPAVVGTEDAEGTAADLTVNDPRARTRRRVEAR